MHEFLSCVRLTKHYCRRKDHTNQSREKRQEGPRIPQLCRKPQALQTSLPPPHPHSLANVEDIFRLIIIIIFFSYTKCCQERDNGGGELMLKIKEETAEGSGATVKAKQLPWLVQQQQSESQRHGRRRGSRGDSPRGDSCEEGRLLPAPARTPSEPGGAAVWSSKLAHSSHSFTPPISSPSLGIGKAVPSLLPVTPGAYSTWVSSAVRTQSFLGQLDQAFLLRLSLAHQALRH